MSKHRAGNADRKPRKMLSKDKAQRLDLTRVGCGDGVSIQAEVGDIPRVYVPFPHGESYGASVLPAVG